MAGIRIFSPKRVAVAIFLLTVIIGVFGVGRLKNETDAAAGYIPRHGPEREFYDRYRAEFTPDFGTVVIATGDVWRADRWQAFCALAEELEALEVVERVIGLPNADYVKGAEEGVDVEDFVDLVPDAGAELRDIAIAYEPYIGTLVTPDGSSIALYVPATVEDSIAFDKEVSPVVDKYVEIFKDENGGDLFQAGDHYVSAEIARQTEASTLMIGLTMIIMLIVAGVALRSFVGGIMCVASGIFGAFFTFALMGFLGITLNSVNSLVVQMIIPYGTAYTIHAVDYVRRDRQFFLGLVPVSGVAPFLFAGTSTMLGFGMTAVSTVHNIVQLGLLGVFGIGMVMYTTIFLTFPVTARLASRRPPTPERSAPAVLLRALDVPRPVLFAITAALLVASTFGALQIRMNYEPIEYLLPGNVPRENADHGSALFSRHTMPLVFTGEKPGDALDPERWVQIETLLVGLERDYPGLRSSWLYDQVKQLSLAYTADEAEPKAMPDSADLIAQYLVLFSERDLEPYLDSERRDLSVALGIPFRNSDSFDSFQDDVNARIATAGLDGKLTGRQWFFFEVGDIIARENLESVGMGLAVLLLLFVVITRSVKRGSAAILTNAIPVAGCIAFMVALGIDLDIGSSIVAAIALGMIVDDTGHMVTRYVAHRYAGLAPRPAATKMISELWYSVTMTTVAIAIGFSVMNFATLVPFHTFSRTLTATMLFALFCDLFLLPALLMHFDRDEAKAA